jgi:hypothetical protein
MLGALTILECFDQDLPRLGRPSGNQYKSVGGSGTTTGGTTPPKVLLCGSSQPLVDKAGQGLKRSDFQHGCRAKNKAHTDLGDSFPLHSEADVVEASACFIMSAIYEILNIMYPNRWLRRSECTNKKSSKATSQQNDEADSDDNINQTSRKKGKGKQKKIAKAKENLRYNLIFKDKESGRTIAVLEYKKTGMIKYDDCSCG